MATSECELKRYGQAEVQLLADLITATCQLTSQIRSEAIEALGSLARLASDFLILQLLLDQGFSILMERSDRKTTIRATALDGKVTIENSLPKLVRSIRRACGKKWPQPVKDKVRSYLTTRR